MSNEPLVHEDSQLGLNSQSIKITQKSQRRVRSTLRLRQRKGRAPLPSITWSCDCVMPGRVSQPGGWGGGLHYDDDVDFVALGLKSEYLHLPFRTCIQRWWFGFVPLCRVTLPSSNSPCCWWHLAQPQRDLNRGCTMLQCWCLLSCVISIFESATGTQGTVERVGTAQ